MGSFIKLYFDYNFYLFVAGGKKSKGEKRKDDERVERKAPQASFEIITLAKEVKVCYNYIVMGSKEPKELGENLAFIIFIRKTMLNNKIKTKYFIQIFAFAFIFFVFSGNASASEITADNVINFVNQAREENGLSDLMENEKLVKIAQDKLSDMIQNDYFAHTSPKGTTPWFWFEKNGYDYKYAGENLAMSFQSAEAQQQAWMDSATHRKNILNSNYQEIGVAVGIEKINGENSIIAVQEFGTVAGAANINDNKNFSSGKDNLIKDSEKNIPQVLAMKDSSLNNSGANNIPAIKESGEIFENKSSAIELASAVSLFLLVVSLALIPMAFLAVAFEKIMILRETEKQINVIPANAGI